MLGKKKISLSRIILNNINSLPLESPFGDTSMPTPKQKRKAFFKKLKQYKQEQLNREMILLPNKTQGDVPSQPKLKSFPNDTDKIKDLLGNIVKIPKSQLDQFMALFKQSSADISSTFLEQIAPVLLSFEDAMNYSTVALRDGLSYDGEIDLEILPMLEWVTRLTVLEVYINKLPISDTTKMLFLRLCAIKAVDKAFLTKNISGITTNVDNKVAGIVTSLGELERGEKNIKDTLNYLNRFKKTKVGPSTSLNTPTGIVQRKNRP